MQTTSSIPHTFIADASILRELGEWMALGFYQGSALPWPRAYGLAYRRLYEQMAVRVPEEGLLTPFEPFPEARTRASHEEWSATALLCDFNHHCGVRVNPQLAEEKKARFPQHAGFIDALLEDLGRRLPHFGGYTHSNPDMRRVVHDGFLAMEAELQREVHAVQAQGAAAAEGEINFLLTMQDYAAGVRACYATTLQALREAATTASGERAHALHTIADSFAGCFLQPSHTFLQGLLAVNFTWMLDGCDSIGRLDQVLGPLFEADQRAGVLDLALARQLLDELFQAFERLNGWNLQIGGYTPEGADGANALTLELIAACARNTVRRPNVAFRVTKATPDAAVLAALDALALGSGRPALYNDDLYVDTLAGMDLGLTLEDAREIGFGGCTETMIAGMSNVGSLEGEINLAKCLELALYDGYDPITQRQQAPHTGRFVDFITFDAFLAALKQQIQYATDSFAAAACEQLRQRFTSGDPKIARSMFTRDCVKNHTAFEAGGARYNWAVVSYQGVANLIDSVAAIKHCVYDTGALSREMLLQALAADFDGYDDIRRRLQAAPTFGNDLPYADDLGHDLIDFAWRELYRRETPRGGRFLASVILFVTYHAAGLVVGALPDGRKACEVLTDSIGAAPGRDTHGPTALLNSVTKLPLTRGVGTPVLNLRFPKMLLTQPASRAGILALLRTFFARGGMQVQLSVLSKDEMLAAQQHPEQYQDLIVRIGGYSEYFTRLAKELQDSVIARTECAV